METIGALQGSSKEVVSWATVVLGGRSCNQHNTGPCLKPSPEIVLAPRLYGNLPTEASSTPTSRHTSRHTIEPHITLPPREGLESTGYPGPELESGAADCCTHLSHRGAAEL